MNTLKLRPLIENFQAAVPAQEPKKEWTNEEKKAALENIGCYNETGRHLYREHNLMEIAHKLSEITKMAEELAVHETGKVAEGNQSWFDEQTVKKNFGHLRKISEEFNKLAKEAHTLQQRMEALYEDGAHIVGRYYEIKDLKEGTAPAVSKIVGQ
jgi:ABC-type uncharacterized transport system ATPase subunit